MSRQHILQKELEQVTNLNKSVDALIESVKKAGDDISTVKTASDSAGGLLEDWIKILNQANFAQNALEDPQWKGSLDEDTIDENNADLAQVDKLQAELDSLNAQNDLLRQKLDSQPDRRRR